MVNKAVPPMYSEGGYFEMQRRLKGATESASTPALEKVDGRDTTKAMMECKFWDRHTDQINLCKMYELSCEGDRCMYLHFDEYCDYINRKEV
jgi:hypothetical protein